MFRSRTISLNLVMWRPRNSPCRLTCSTSFTVTCSKMIWHSAREAHYSTQSTGAMSFLEIWHPKTLPPAT